MAVCETAALKAELNGTIAAAATRPATRYFLAFVIEAPS
jgi:hypothetical protein